MDLVEHSQLTPEEEQDHWWIKTRFCYIEKVVKILERRTKILEVGCGTCQNLAFLRSHSTFSSKIESVVGFDPEFKQIPSFSWQKQNDIFTANLQELNQKYDVILAMDVLEHLEDDLLHLQTWLKYLKKDGVILITVPAFECLWSYHDELLLHKRRYTKRSLKKLTSAANLIPQHLSFAFSHIFLPAFVIRKLIAPFSKPQTTDLQKSSALVNKLLYTLGKIEANLGGNPVMGTSVVGIFKFQNVDIFSAL